MICDVTLGVGLTGVAHVCAAVGDFVLVFLILDQTLDIALKINQDRAMVVAVVVTCHC